MKKVLLVFFILNIFASFFSFSEEWMLPVVYAQMKNSFSIFFFDEKVINDYYVGNEFLGSGSVSLGALMVRFPVTIETSFLLSVPQKDINVNNFYISYFTDSVALSLGKQNAFEGSGNICRPLFVFDFYQDVNRNDLDKMFLWQTNISKSDNKGIWRINSFFDTSFVEKQEELNWFAILLKREHFLRSTSLTAQMVYLYKAEADFANNVYGSIEYGVDANHVFNDSISMTLASSIAFPVNHSENQIKSTFLVNFLSPDKKIYLTPEISYYNKQWYGGGGVGYSPVSGFFSCGLMSRYDFKNPANNLILTSTIHFTKHMTFFADFSWAEGMDTSSLVQPGRPFILTCSLQINLF